MITPPLPTDNLYKFLFLAGTAAALLCANESWNISRSLSNTQIELQTQSLLLKEDSSRSAINLRTIHSKIKTLAKHTHCSICEPNDEYIMVPLVEPNDVFGMKLRGEIFDLINVHFESVNSRNKEAILLQGNISQHEHNKSNQENLQSVLTIALISSIILAISGALLWYIRLQRFQDIIVRNESRKSGMVP